MPARERPSTREALAREALARESWLPSPTGPALVEVEERAERVARVTRVARDTRAEVERAEVERAEVESGSMALQWRGSAMPTEDAMWRGATWIGPANSTRILMMFSLVLILGFGLGLHALFM